MQRRRIPEFLSSWCPQHCFSKFLWGCDSVRLWFLYCMFIFIIPSHSILIIYRGNCISHPLTIVQKRYCTHTLRNSTRTPYLYSSNPRYTLLPLTAVNSVHSVKSLYIKLQFGPPNLRSKTIWYPYFWKLESHHLFLHLRNDTHPLR